MVDLDEKLLGVSEAAKLLGVHENTLRDWDAEGKLQAIRTKGGHRRYSLDQIREYINSNEEIKNVNNQTEKEEQYYVERRAKKYHLETIMDKWKNTPYVNNQDCDKNLVLLLENCERYYLYNGEWLPGALNLHQALELTQLSWNCSKLKNYISVQVIESVGGLAFYLNQDSLASDLSMQSENVIAHTIKYNFDFIAYAIQTDFDHVKKHYAQTIGAEIDDYIFQKLPNKIDLEPDMENGLYKIYGHRGSIEYLVSCDYVAGPTNYINELRKNPLLNHVDLIEVSPTHNKELYYIQAAAGNKPKFFMTKPIFVPYLIIYDEAKLSKNARKAMCSFGWLD